jgi:hypothetical protein
VPRSLRPSGLDASGRQLRDAVTAFDSMFEQIDLVDVDDALAHRAGELAEVHRLRGHDAVHLAAADRVRGPDLVVIAQERARGSADPNRPAGGPKLSSP